MLTSAAPRKRANTNGSPRAERSEIISPEFRAEVAARSIQLGQEIKDRGVPLVAIARLLGVSKQYVEQIFSGDQPISAYRLATIGKLLGYKVRIELIREG